MMRFSRLSSDFQAAKHSLFPNFWAQSPVWAALTSLTISGVLSLALFLCVQKGIDRDWGSVPISAIVILFMAAYFFLCRSLGIPSIGLYIIFLIGISPVIAHLL